MTNLALRVYKSYSVPKAGEAVSLASGGKPESVSVWAAAEPEAACGFNCHSFLQLRGRAAAATCAVQLPFPLLSARGS